jgi:hypothetical protein
MEAEFAELSREFRNAAECCGAWTLELVAAKGYLDRLMGNARLDTLRETFRSSSRSFKESWNPYPGPSRRILRANEMRRTVVRRNFEITAAKNIRPMPTRKTMVCSVCWSTHTPPQY